MAVPGGYRPPNAAAPSSVSSAGTSFSRISPSRGARSAASKVTSGRSSALSPPSVVTSAVSVPPPSATVTRKPPRVRSRPLPVNRTAPVNSASTVPRSGSAVPEAAGKRKSAPPSWAPPVSCQEPSATGPVTYSRNVRRTPQSTAPSARVPFAPSRSAPSRSASSPSPVSEGSGSASDPGPGAAGAAVSAVRVTGSSASPAW